MTEDEAKTKWCPFVRVMALDPRNGGNPAINRQDYDNFNCIGPACMAWRWNDTSEWIARAEAEFRRTGRRIPKTDGYCGLAGRPS